MFKLEITKIDGEKELVYNMNKKEDDFLRFIPRNYGVSMDNVKAWYFGDDTLYEVEAYLKLEDHLLDLGENGEIRVVKKVTTPSDLLEEDSVYELIKSYDGALVTNAYDSKGNFVKDNGL